jgi:hypothetical protein
MELDPTGRAFLGVGAEAPPPSGDPDPALRTAMLRQAHKRFFCWRVNLWARLLHGSAFDWANFIAKLERAEYRAFASRRQALRSVGYFGTGPSGEWVFGCAWFRLWLFGASAMRHELFHAAQEHHVGITNPKPGLLRSLAIEYSAHLWGGPLIGIPFVYGGTLLILGGLVALLVLLFDLIFVVLALL